VECLSFSGSGLGFYRSAPRGGPFLTPAFELCFTAVKPRLIARFELLANPMSCIGIVGCLFFFLLSAAPALPDAGYDAMHPFPFPGVSLRYDRLAIFQRPFQGRDAPSG
jgi:hypothetical protein